MTSLLEKILDIPRRVEPLGGQNYTYVRLEEVITLAAEYNAKQNIRFTKGGLDVAAERQRQMDVKNFAPERDDAYVRGELFKAALFFITGNYLDWPWSMESLMAVKNKKYDRRACLVRAAALLVAEIDRLDRMAATKD